MDNAMRFVASILLLVACGITHAADSPTVAAVSRLYHDFAWEAVMFDPNAVGLADQPKAVLVNYFTPQLAAAIAADAACKARHREICALDFGLLWGSQDPEAQDLSITQGHNRNEVHVEFITSSTHKKIVLLFHVASTKAGWRVSDITYPSGYSLAKILADGAE